MNSIIETTMTVVWISVTDRLPKDGQDVLIAWHQPRKQSYKPQVQSAEYRHWLDDNLRMFRTDGGGFAVGNKDAPTHWAEMPLPPKENDMPQPSPQLLALPLTKRELIAAMAMQGMIAAGWSMNPDASDTRGYNSYENAVQAADRLIIELNKPRPKP